MHSSCIAFLLLAASAAAPALAAPARFGDISLRSDGARAPLDLGSLDLAVRGIIDFLNEDSAQETLTRNAGTESEEPPDTLWGINDCHGEPLRCPPMRKKDIK
ncbi:hypothetical protein BC827DRAFT_1155203 [Russula dissimulans]|nr:hypothetical protein BC827DRAFT_1155203 [Russula dissimulans]